MSVRGWIVSACWLGLLASPAWSREWTDKAGKRIEAELVTVKADKVYLERSDGTLLTLPLADLSAADRDYLRSLSTPAATRSASDPKQQTLARRALARTLGALKVRGGTIKRDVFVEVFARAAVDLRVATGPAALRGRPLLPARGDGPELAVGKSRDLGEMNWGVKSLAFSPDGGRLAVGKMDRAVLFVDINTAARLSVQQDLESLGQVTASCFTPRGDKLLSGGYTGKIVIWDVAESGALVQAGQFVGHSGEIASIVVSTDGRFALSGGEDKAARYWEVETGRELAEITGFKRGVIACHLYDDGRQASATDGTTLVRYDLVEKSVAGTVNLGIGSSQGAAISPDGSRVVVADGYALRMWNTASGAELPKFQDRETQWTVSFSPDGERVLSGGRGKFNVWDVATQKRLHSGDVGGGVGYVQTLAISPDGRYVATILSMAGQKLQLYRISDDR